MKNPNSWLCFQDPWSFPETENICVWVKLVIATHYTCMAFPKNQRFFHVTLRALFVYYFASAMKALLSKIMLRYIGILTVHLITESARVAKETERYTAWTHWTKFSLSGYWVMNGWAVYTAQIFWKTTYLITEIAHGRETHWHGYDEQQLIWWLRQPLSSLQEGSTHSTETLNRGNSHLGQEAGG